MGRVESHVLNLFQANAVIDMIGFPEYILNKTRLDSEYKGVSFLVYNITVQILTVY